MTPEAVPDPRVQKLEGDCQGFLGQVQALNHQVGLLKNQVDTLGPLDTNLIERVSSLSEDFERLRVQVGVLYSQKAEGLPRSPPRTCQFLFKTPSVL